MMLRAFWAVVAPWEWCLLYVGGRSSSSTATTSTVQTTDNRIAAGEGATVLRAGGDLASGDVVRQSGSGNVVEQLSDDVVRAAFEYAASRDALAGESLDRVLSAAENTVARTVAQTQGQLTERTTLLLVLAAAVGVFALGWRR